MKKLEAEMNVIKKQHEELSGFMSDPLVIKDAPRYKKLQDEFAQCVRLLSHAEHDWESHYLKLIESDPT